MKLTLTLLHDPEPMDPTEENGWMLYSFNTRHSNVVNPIEKGWLDNRGDFTNPGLRQKADRGLAYKLGYFEHGNSLWFIKGERPLGTEGDFRWDGCDFAGLLIWEGRPKDLGPKTPEDRAEDARMFLRTYTAWMNGDVYGYVIEDENGKHVDSCFGFYGPDLEYMFEQVREHTKGHEVTVQGEAAGLSQYHDVA